MIVPFLLLAVGIVILVVGAESLVRGASRLALAMGLSRITVGLVVVAAGTSAPEAAVALGATFEGRADLALGNVVGSNTYNVLFILGLLAAIAPLVVQRRVVRVDVPVMVGVSLLFVVLALDGSVGQIDGILLLLLAVAYLSLNVRIGRREQAEGPVVPLHPGRGGSIFAALLVAVGVGALIFGARLTVSGASEIARGFGVSDLVIGLTVVAVGTGLPETVTSVLAVVRRERDIAVGNIVGSCVLNLLLVSGLAAAFAPSGIDVALGVRTFDLPVMAAAAIVVLPMAFTRQVLARWEGLLFLMYYVAYIAYLVLDAQAHPGSHDLAAAFLGFVLPLTVVVLVASVVRELRRRNASRA